MCPRAKQWMPSSLSSSVCNRSWPLTSPWRTTQGKKKNLPAGSNKDYLHRLAADSKHDCSKRGIWFCQRSVVNSSTMKLSRITCLYDTWRWRNASWDPVDHLSIRHSAHCLVCSVTTHAHPQPWNKRYHWLFRTDKRKILHEVEYNQIYSWKLTKATGVLCSADSVQDRKQNVNKVLSGTLSFAFVVCVAEEGGFSVICQTGQHTWCLCNEWVVQAGELQHRVERKMTGTHGMFMCVCVCELCKWMYYWHADLVES